MPFRRGTALLADRISIGSAVIGMVLMIAALATGANPVEGSVITPVLRDTLVGNVVLIVLIGTSFPTILLADQVLHTLWRIGIPVPSPLFYLCAVILQGLIYFGLAKLVLFCVGKARRS